MRQSETVYMLFNLSIVDKSPQMECPEKPGNEQGSGKVGGEGRSTCSGSPHGHPKKKRAGGGRSQ
jgi:hypothetical protein